MVRHVPANFLAPTSRVASVPPLLMADRQLIELVPAQTPVRHISVHEGDEAGIVRRFQKVRHLMGHNIFEALLASWPIPCSGEWFCRRGYSFPSWGARNLKARLERMNPNVSWPAASTVGQILSRAGLTNPKRRKRLRRDRNRSRW